MTELEEYSDHEIFAEYDKRVAGIAQKIVEELNEKNMHSTVDGREWCDDNDVPERAFSDAMKHFTDGVDWGISPMYPMRSEEEAEWINQTVEVEVENTDQDEGEEVEDE